MLLIAVDCAHWFYENQSNYFVDIDIAALVWKRYQGKSNKWASRWLELHMFYFFLKRDHKMPELLRRIV